MIDSYTTRDNELAERIGDTNRFGQTPYSVKGNVVMVDGAGRAVHPPFTTFDSREFARQEKKDSDNLYQRRLKDNWI